MSTGTIQNLFNTRNSVNYGVGQAGVGGGSTAQLVGTTELFVTETVTQALANAAHTQSSARATQGLVRFRGYAVADQKLTVTIQLSVDGVTWRSPDTSSTGFTVTGAAASAAVAWDVPAVAPFMRVDILNNSGAAATTFIECVTDLIAGG